MVLGFSESLKLAAKGALCFALATEDPLLRFFKAPFGGLANDVTSPANKLRKQICNDSQPVNFPSVPYSGGQCDCNRYQIRTTLAYRQGDGPLVDTDFVHRFRGPVESISPYLSGTGKTHGLTYKCRGHNFSNLSSWPSCGAVEFPTSTRTVAGDPITEQFIVDSVIEEAPDGDDCGGKDVGEFVPISVVKNFTYVNNKDVEVTEEGDFNILAPVIIGGNLIAPVTVNVGGIDFPLNFDLTTGDVTFDFSRDFVPNPNPIADPNPTENPTGDEPATDEENLFYGLICYSTPTGAGRVSTTLVGQTGATTLHLPRTGNVWFLVPVGNRLSWVGPVAVQGANQVIMVPYGLAALDYSLVPSSGWAMEAVRIGKPDCGCNCG